VTGFDWVKFLTRHRLDYAASGANVSKGYLVVRCPFCGDDPSLHLSIHMAGRGWRCWRNPDHRGRSHAYLIQHLLHCTADEARRLAGEDTTVAPDSDALVATLALLRQYNHEPTQRDPLEFPPEFRSLDAPSPLAQHFWSYLRRRGYRDGEIHWLTETYELKYAVRGEFAWRVIVPIRDQEGALLTWTGRTTGDSVEPRYRTLSSRSGPPLAPTSRTILGLPQLLSVPEPRALVICEGPFDALRLVTSGHSLGVWATCLFGLSLSEDQQADLNLVGERFPRVYLALDTAAHMHQLGMSRQLYPLRAEMLELPAGVDDPGDLTGARATKLCLELI